MRCQKLYKTLFFFSFLFSNLTFAQNFPVDCRVLLAPPYTGKFTDITNSPTKFRVQLLLKDLTKSSIDISLRIRLKGQGVWLENPEGLIASKPITLTPGVPKTFSALELAEYFEPQNIEAQGIDYAQLLNGVSLPFGFYEWEVVAIELYRNREVSNVGRGKFYIQNNYPPLLNMPRDESVVPELFPQNLLFSWTPRHITPALGTGGLLYHLYLYEIPEDDASKSSAADIQALINSGTPNMQELLSDKPYYNYGASNLPLRAGKRYAWQVRVESFGENDGFLNDGYSDIKSFVYGHLPCPRPFNLQAKVDADDGSVALTWEAPSDALSFKIAYNAQPTGIKTERSIKEKNYLLIQQPRGFTYAWQVRSVCQQGQSEPSKETFDLNEAPQDSAWISDPNLTYTPKKDPKPKRSAAHPDVLQTVDAEQTNEITAEDSIDTILNTPIKIFIPAEGEELPEGIPASQSILPKNATVEQLQAALKTKKPTCSGIVSTYSCGNHDITPTYNGTIIPVNTGDEVAMNSLVLSIVSIDGSGNGSGLIKIPMMNNIKLGVTLSGIQVAEGGCVVAGKAELNGISASVLTEQQRVNLEKAYTVFNQVIDAGIANAGAIAETINNLKDFIQKAKDFSKNYKGGNTDAKKAKIYEEYAKNAQKVLLNSKNLPATIRADLESKIVATQPAWDFFKTGNKCNGTSAGKGGPNFEDYTNECEAFSAAIIAEMDAMEEAEGSFTCNCSPIISECSPIKDILSQIKEANFSKKESISISKTDNKDKLSNDTDWVSALNGIDIGGKCFKFSLEFKFSGDKIDLNPNSYKETKNGYDLVDEKDNTLLSINILNESGQSKYLKQAVLKEYLGFEENSKIPILKIYSMVYPNSWTVFLLLLLLNFLFLLLFFFC